MRSAAFLVIILVIASACSGFDPDAPWTLSSGPEDAPTPIPEGTRIIEHEAVPIDERSEQIGLVEDLVIPGGIEPFYRPIDIDVDAAGNIYVFDAGNQNVVTFDRYGNYTRTLGRGGQGPGEIGEGGRIAIVSGYLVHLLWNRVNVWSETGESIGSFNMRVVVRMSLVGGTEEGLLVGFVRRRGATGRQVVVAVDLEGSSERELVDLPSLKQLMVIQGSRARSTGVPVARPDIAMTPSGDIYATAGSDYEVLALAADGRARWAIRVPWPRLALTDDRIDQALRHVMGRDEDNDIPSTMIDVRRSDVEWPELLPALIGGASRPYARPLAVDGHGHLYVFPFFPEDWDRPDQPVDVYSREGEHLFSGMIPMVRWESARADYIYGIGRDPVSEEYTVVRYRLIEPF
ncbi:MAG: hypothetical protein PVJ49_01050 [Acidobacteriota bacterium]|jgi:hypothetical protein